MGVCLDNIEWFLGIMEYEESKVEKDGEGVICDIDEYDVVCGLEFMEGVNVV